MVIMLQTLSRIMERLLVYDIGHGTSVLWKGSGALVERSLENLIVFVALAANLAARGLEPVTRSRQSTSSP